MKLFHNLTKIQLILLLCIVLAAAYIRFFDLGKIPLGLTNDEANVGYDAYAILKTGKDQWEQRQPSTYLIGFGDYRPPVYTYVVAGSEAIFGLNEFAVRFPSAVAGTLTVVLVFFLALLLWDNIPIAIVATFFLAFNPWHVAMSRVGIESTFGVFLVTLGFILFIVGLSKRRWLFPAIALFALSCYTYPSYVVLGPLFVAILFFVYHKNILLHKKDFFIGLCLFIILLLPLFIGGSLKTASVRSGQVNLTHDTGLINVVNDKRGSCQTDFQNKLCQVFENKYTTFFAAFVSNYFDHFSPDLLAITGTTTQYSVLPQRGLLYLSEYFFLFAGIVFLLKKKKYNGSILVLLWILVAPIPDSITGAGHYSRFLPVLPAFQMISAVGLYEIWTIFKYKKWILIPIFSIILYEIFSFLLIYWSYFPSFYAQFSLYGYKDLMRYVYQNKNNYKRIIISSSVNDTKQYVFYLFYTKYDPALYQSGKDVEKVTESGGWIRVKRIGNIYFLPSIPVKQVISKQKIKPTLLIGAPIEFPKKAKVKDTIKDPKGNIIFQSVQENLIF